MAAGHALAVSVLCGAGIAIGWPVAPTSFISAALAAVSLAIAVDSDRCRRALEAGLMLQVGCQVGESSLLSAAQLALMAEVSGIRYFEGCFGTYLLERDPISPELRFGRGGRPPQRPAGPGLGVDVDTNYLEQCMTRCDEVS